MCQIWHECLEIPNRQSQEFFFSISLQYITIWRQMNRDGWILEPSISVQLPTFLFTALIKRGKLSFCSKMVLTLNHPPLNIYAIAMVYGGGPTERNVSKSNPPCPYPTSSVFWAVLSIQIFFIRAPPCASMSMERHINRMYSEKNYIFLWPFLSQI